MKANFFKRLFAYIIDISLLLILVLLFFDTNSSSIKANNTDYLNGLIDYSEYFLNNANLILERDKQNILVYIINIMYIILYFVIFPLYNDGKTLGKMMMGIKVEGSYNQSLTFKSLFLRNLIINGLLYLIVCLLFLYLLSPKIYLFVITLAGIVQLSLVFISVFMVIYRKDKKGLHDLASKTKVVTIK